MVSLVSVFDYPMGTDVGTDVLTSLAYSYWSHGAFVMSHLSVLRRTLIPAFLPMLLLMGMEVAGEERRVNEPGQQPDDVRLRPLKDLNGYFPFEVPAGPAAWEARAAELRQRVKIATGIWPQPKRTPLNAVIHGRVQRDGFTVEKVYFESVPDHFVTGLLFRPDDGKKDVKRPAVLSPHGHGGRMQDYGADKMKALIESGAEKFEQSGRFPKLARCAHLARMGCVVFIYDMLGYADSQQISYELAHRIRKRRPEFEDNASWGLYSPQAELRLQSVMGLQTWNSIRGLDFLQQLPDVDGKRIGVTGGSGGGTQTILLCAIDERPVTAFPNGMVSTAMQGGCTCENCTLLRIGTGNVELAALFAPKPQAMTAANDWTKEMMTKGYPQLQQLYSMLGAKDRVFCRPMLHFPHNYNYVSRATMYEWFNRYLGLQLKEYQERDYEILTAAEAAVWNDEHPQPAGGADYERALTKYLSDESDKQIAALQPKDEASLVKYREVVGGAFETIIGRGVPAYEDIAREKIDKQQGPGYIYFEDKVALESHGEELPLISLFPTITKWNGDVVIWVDGVGKQGMFGPNGELHSQVKQLLDGGASVVSADLFQQGEFLQGIEPVSQQRVVSNPREVAAYSFCYNHTLFARRVHDVLTVISYIKNDEHAPKRLQLIGLNGGGPIAAAARAIAGDMIDKAAIDTRGFRFTQVKSYRDPNFLPGAVKYGDLPAMLALNAPHALWLGGEEGTVPQVTQAAYAASGHRDRVAASALQSTMDAGVAWLLQD
ncbi:MAG: acetylxylan esterase [Blastopirellula sp.]|nr:acetylxylan esterase [Blastopirellula sp.]